MNTTLPPMPGTTTSQRCGLATTSLVLGILSVVTCILGPLFGIPAVICGHKAMGRIKRSSGALGGNGLALGGLITGYISIAMIPIFGLLSAIAIPNFVRARQTAQMHSCVNNLRQIDSAKQQWALEKGKDATAEVTESDITPYLVGRNSTRQITTGQMLVCPAGGTYEIKSMSEEPTCTIPGHALTK